MSEIETLHRPFAKWLRSEGLYFINPRSDCPSTIIEGHPDFTILHQSGALLIEFKDKEGKLSLAQTRCIDALETNGMKVHVLRDLSRAIGIVQAWRSTLKPCHVVEKKRPLTTRFGGRLYEIRGNEMIPISEP